MENKAKWGGGAAVIIALVAFKLVLRLAMRSSASDEYSYETEQGVYNADQLAAILAELEEHAQDRAMNDMPFLGSAELAVGDLLVVDSGPQERRRFELLRVRRAEVGRFSLEQCIQRWSTMEELEDTLMTHAGEMTTALSWHGGSLDGPDASDILRAHYVQVVETYSGMLPEPRTDEVRIHPEYGPVIVQSVESARVRGTSPTGEQVSVTLDMLRRPMTIAAARDVREELRRALTRTGEFRQETSSPDIWDLGDEERPFLAGMTLADLYERHGPDLPDAAGRELEDHLLAELSLVLNERREGLFETTAPTPAPSTGGVIWQ